MAAEITSENCEVQFVHFDAVAKAKANMPDDDTLYDVAELFKVFGDSTRTRILSALCHADLCVCDIATLLNMTNSAVSHQLRILRQSKLVKATRNGKEVFYSLDDDHVTQILRTALEHITE